MTNCPGDDTLIALVEHALPAVRVEAIADHVDGCERCRATIGHLAAVDPAAQKPAMVGRYRLEEQLGVGGMGVVWAAWDPMLERRVAIKLMRPEVGEHGPARLMREARALAQLQHPNVVAVFDVGEHAGEVFIATELVDGEPLDRWQVERTQAAIVAAYVQAARGLAAAHAMGLVHRDVKPANLFVARDGRVRVGDFGLARRDDPSTKLTDDGAVVGTPAYMAPEQRAGKPVDGRADQFALCVALAEALTGKRPAADARGFDLPKHLAAALATGLARDPDARFVDMTALAEALAAPPPTPKRRWPLVAMGVVLAAGAAAGGTAWVMTSSPSPSALVIASPPPPTVTIASAPVIDAAPPPIPAPPPPARVAPKKSGSGSGSIGPDAYFEAIAHVTYHRRDCLASFAAFDAGHGVRPSVMSAHDDALFRARCQLLAGRCPEGERELRALFTADGLSVATVAEDAQREVDMNCPTSVGTWKQRLAHLQYQMARLQFAPLAELSQALADAAAIARDAGAAMTPSDQIDLTNALGFIEEGFARLANHCADARRARAIGTYDPMAMTPALKVCLTTTAP